MRVSPSLSEWSSCNCFSLEQLEAAQRNRIETTFAFEMSRDGEEGGSTALLPYTELHHLHTPSLLPSLLLSFIVSLSPSLPPPYLLPPPPPPPFRSMALLALSFQRVPRSTGACSSEQGIVHLVLPAMDELICVCASVCMILDVLLWFVHIPRPAYVSIYVSKYMVVYVCGSNSYGW